MSDEESKEAKVWHDDELYDGNQIDIWKEKFHDSEETSITLRIGVTTVMMPHSIFLELCTAIKQAEERLVQNLR